MFAREIRTLEGICWIGIGIIICILALQFDLGSFHEPGPGFVAFLSGLFLSAIGLIMTISKAVWKKRLGQVPEGDNTFQIISWSRLTYTTGLLLGYTLLIEILGYILATFLLIWGMFYDWEKKNWAWSLLFSIVTALGSYIMFEVWLRCQLPRGVFPWW
jgi:hypothetical protein